MEKQDVCILYVATVCASTEDTVDRDPLSFVIAPQASMGPAASMM